MSTPLSHRGTAAVSQPLRADLDLFFEAADDLYHPRENPDGKFTLCIAENSLCREEMEDKLRGIAAGPIPDWVPSYTNITGSPELREAAAGFLTRFVSGVEHAPERMAAAAGAAAVIELSAVLLGDPDDVVVIPAPAYMAYTGDLGNIAGLKRYDLVPESQQRDSGIVGQQGANDAGDGRLSPAPSSPHRTGGPAPFATTYDLTTADLDQALADLGDRFRLLLLTQPNNPTGQVYSAEQLRTISDWCDAHHIHLVVNEIYALSLLDQSHPDLATDYAGSNTFQTILPLIEEKKSPYLHWWYAVSKDFGLSGLRLGLVYSYNEDYIRAWGNYGAGSMVSNHTQWLLARVFADHRWTDNYIRINQQRITESYATVIRTLRAHDVPYAPAAGSLFVWLDLSRYLTADTEAAELALWNEIYQRTGILLTSPLGMGGNRRGWLRLVYSCVSPDDLRAAMQRLGDWLGNKKLP